MDVTLRWWGCFQVVCIPNSDCKMWDSVLGRAVPPKVQCVGTCAHHSSTGTPAATAQPRPAK